MIPYLPHPVIEIGTLSISAFTLTLGLAIWTFVLVAERTARPMALDGHVAGWIAFAALLCGWLGSRLMVELTYFPDRFATDGWSSLWQGSGMSSTGAMSGGLIGALLITRALRWSTPQVLSLCDALAIAAGCAWTVGRLGCALAHDHPGIESSAWIAVAYPSGPRLNMGLIEFLLLLPAVATMLWLHRRRRSPGLAIGFGLSVYGAMRFTLDFWRTNDAVYAGLTPAQYLCLLFLLAGACVLLRRRRAASPAISSNDNKNEQ